MSYEAGGIEEKRCTGCGITKPRSNFYLYKSQPSKISQCKACLSESRKERYKKSKHKEIDRYFVRKYGITLEERDALVLEQGGKCKICSVILAFETTQKNQKQNNQKGCVDHCHETEEIRGILCNQCNKGLGSFKDNTEILQKAIDYLKDTNSCKAS